MPNKTTQIHTLDSLPKSSLHDRIHEIVNSCYAPESSPNGDVYEAMTQDILKILSQQQQEMKWIVRRALIKQQQEDYQEVLDLVESKKVYTAEGYTPESEDVRQAQEANKIYNHALDELRNAIAEKRGKV